ncbi:MAG: DUF2796 domain-containing protein [Maricaulis sp.]|jgi:hypothetical protein|nr:DUF2796 domain-containing protein [Maricaulis sp.]MDG2045162.1 DUF2796 domain-containing protein [Maricaulis sp.]
MSFVAIAFLATLSASSQHGTHVHGSAELAIALDQAGAIQIELSAPAHDIYGFEHTAETAGEQAAIADANARLSLKSGLIELGEADCVLSDAQIERSDAAHGHGNVRVLYSGTCAHAERVRVVSTTLFDHFSRLSQIDGILISTHFQTVFELTPASPSARLSR